MSPSASARNDAVLALAGLQRSGTITSYRTNFMLLAQAGATPEVTVTIPATDELAIERVRRSVQRAIEPHIGGAQVVVVPETTTGGGNEDRFDCGTEDDQEP